jgi:hypothetical protein
MSPNISELSMGADALRSMKGTMWCFGFVGIMTETVVERFIPQHIPHNHFPLSPVAGTIFSEKKISLTLTLS